jgi:gentisate 1,2-dioxygenase
LGRSVRIAPRDTPYDRWLVSARDEIPMFEGLVIDDVRAIALEPWPQMGEAIRGLYLRFADYQMTDGLLLELPPGGATAPRRELFEIGVYFLGGPGHTVLHQEGREPRTLSWKKGSLLSIPLNVRHWHVSEAAEPIRLLAVTSFPFVINSTNNEGFVRDNAHAFPERYDGEPGFVDSGGRVAPNVARANVVHDVPAAALDEDDLRGGEGAWNLKWLMAGNTMLTLHASELSPRTYKKAHRHSSDAFILLLSGRGYSIAWPDGAYERRVRVDWHEGTLFVPPMYWYHQHLNTSEESARYVAISTPDLVRNLGLRFSDQMEVSLPEVAEEWEAELRKADAARKAR